MKRRRCLAGFGGMLLIFLVGCLFLWRSPPPTWKGRPVQAWFEQYSRSGEVEGIELVDPGQRAEAAAAFAALDLRAVPFLTRVVLDGGNEPFFRRPLRQLGRVVGLTAHAVPRPEERVDDALDLLRHRQIPPATLLGPEVLAALHSPDPDRRLRALTLLACAEEADPVIPHIVGGLRDPEKRVRVAAAASAARFGDAAQPALPALIENLQADWCPIPAIQAVGQLGAHAAEAVPDLERRLATERQLGRAYVAVALCRIQPNHPAALAFLQEAIQDEGDPTRQASALSAIAAAGSNAAFAAPALLTAATHQGTENVGQLIQVLERVNVAHAEEAWAFWTGPEHPATRRIWAAGQWLRFCPAEPRARMLLEHYAHDSDPNLQAYAQAELQSAQRHPAGSPSP